MKEKKLHEKHDDDDDMFTIISSLLEDLIGWLIARKLSPENEE